ncbi:MAG: protein kinase [Planctomycetaceae bacterium]|jgi:serine/threonine protein kinase|nr:protein kinase [Planctomycetaceae bacterium]
MSVEKAIAEDGTTVEFRLTDEHASGAKKDVYWHPQNQYVVAIYKESRNEKQEKWLKDLIAKREKLYGGNSGEYWKDHVLDCWPEKSFQWNGKHGFVMPPCQSRYRFKEKPVGMDKDEKSVFAFQNLMINCLGMEEGRMVATGVFDKLPAAETGDLKGYVQACSEIARGVRWLNNSGLAHSDLSCNNVLVDPLTGRACIIDLDGLVVPKTHEAEVSGTHGYVAPEIYHKTEPSKPCIETDLHSLAVLIYILLFHRHPLLSKRLYVQQAKDGEIDYKKNIEMLCGQKALFVEHPTDKSHPCHERQYEKQHWIDPQQTPYTIHGPHLRELFEKAFIDGLHKQKRRPTAGMWESALLQTRDLLVPCGNDTCPKRWYVVYDTKHLKCPYCGTPYSGVLPVLDFFRKDGTLTGHRLNVHHNLCLRLWHAREDRRDSEQLPEDEREGSVGCFSLLNNQRWYLTNVALNNMKNLTTGEYVPIDQSVELRDGLELLFSTSDTAQKARVRFVNR